MAVHSYEYHYSYLLVYTDLAELNIGEEPKGAQAMAFGKISSIHSKQGDNPSVS